MLLSVILVVVCIMLPYQLAFYHESQKFTNILLIADGFFLIDIILSFLTVPYDDEYNELDDVKVIAKSYLKGWFTIDLLATFPFDMLL